jgi:hypothetical protein
MFLGLNFKILKVELFMVYGFIGWIIYGLRLYMFRVILVWGLGF